jgi:hypothetical protein
MWWLLRCGQYQLLIPNSVEGFCCCFPIFWFWEFVFVCIDFFRYRFLVIHTIQHLHPSMVKNQFEEFTTDLKVLVEAVSIAQVFCDATLVSSHICDFQGMFSKSAVVSLSDKTEVSLNQAICVKVTDGCSASDCGQLKDNKINTTILANTLLGDVIPILVWCRPLHMHGMNLSLF